MGEHNVIPFVISRLQGCFDATNGTSPAGAVEALVAVDQPATVKRWAQLSWSSRGAVVPLYMDGAPRPTRLARLAGVARGRLLVLVQVRGHGPQGSRVWP